MLPVTKQIENKEFISRSGTKYHAEWTYLTPEQCEKHQEFKSSCYEKQNVNGMEIMVLNDKYEELQVNVFFFMNDKYAFTLTKNGYRTNEDQFMLLEWYEKEDKVYLIFNDEHGCLTIFDANSGAKLHSTENNDLFITEYKRFDDYLYISGWVWQPFASRKVFHLPSMIMIPDYESIHITTADIDNDSGRVCHPGIQLFGCTDIHQFLAQRDAIAYEQGKLWWARDFNKYRTSKTLLRLFLTHGEFETEEAKTMLQKMLDENQTQFNINVFGNLGSGDKLNVYATSFYHESNYKIRAPDYKTFEEETNFNTIFTKTLWRTTNHFPFPEINMTVTIETNNAKLQMVITHVLVSNDQGKFDLRKDELIRVFCSLC